MTPEGLVKKKLKAYLKSAYEKGVFNVGLYYFMPVQTGYGARGLDFFVCWNGRFMAIETKKKGVRSLTKLQQVTAREIKSAGGEVWLVTLDENDELEWIKP